MTFTDKLKSVISPKYSYAILETERPKVHLNFVSQLGGWGNGYVAVTREHPWFQKGYDAVDVHVHGGITFSASPRDFKDKNILKAFTPEIPIDEIDNWWVFGFDTAHGGDNPQVWNEKAVREETLALLEQMKKAK
jgi:hypothetical protein